MSAERPATHDRADSAILRARLAHSRSRPWVIAHRGDSFHAPENTLDAAERGFHAGADAWEFDVHLTRDGVPVVIHDEQLVRTTDVAQRFAGDPRGRSGFLVSDFDLDEIRSLDAGSWFLRPIGAPRSAAAFGTREVLPDCDVARFASGAVRVPTLEGALQLTRELDWVANVELKSFPERPAQIVERVLEVIDATATAPRVLISSFDHADLSRMKQLRPRIATGALVSTPLAQPDRYVRELLDAEFYHPSSQTLGSESAGYRKEPCAQSLRRADLQALAESKVPVLVYTVNDTRPDGLAVHLAEAGVRGFFTDDPVGLRATFVPPARLAP